MAMRMSSDTAARTEAVTVTQAERASSFSTCGSTAHLRAAVTRQPRTPERLHCEDSNLLEVFLEQLTISYVAVAGFFQPFS